jgi:hypothetical protein
MSKPALPTVGINVRLPKRLHQRLRVHAVANNLTNTDVVTAALRAYLSAKG